MSSEIGTVAIFSQDIMRQDNCTDCPAGYYCYANTSDYTGNSCPPGFYCPQNTEEPFQYPCPEGTFNSQSGRTAADACLPCTPGFYCEGVGNSAVTGPCDPGWYCTNASISATVSEQLFFRTCYNNTRVNIKCIFCRFSLL